MLDSLRDLFRANPTPATVQAIVAAQREALFTPADLRKTTRHIDPRTASLQEIESALIDCSVYWATCYPETENELVEWIEAECEEAIRNRFACHGTTIVENFLRRIKGK